MKWIVPFVIGLIAAPVLYALAGILGLLGSSATTKPPGWEMSLGMRALDASLEKRSKGLKNPIAANDSAEFAAGAKIYAKSCSGCHGNAKGPSSWGANDFYPRVPQFFQEGSDVTSTEAYAAIHDGVRYSGMAAWGDQMKDEDIWSVANYVARIRNSSPQQPHKMGQMR